MSVFRRLLQLKLLICASVCFVQAQSPVTFPVIGDTVWLQAPKYWYWISPEVGLRFGDDIPARFFSYAFPRHGRDSTFIGWDAHGIYRFRGVIQHPELGPPAVMPLHYDLRVAPGTDTDPDGDPKDGLILLRKRFAPALGDTLYWWLRHTPRVYNRMSHEPDYRSDHIWVLTRQHGIVGFANYIYDGDKTQFVKTLGDSAWFDAALAPLIRRIDPPPDVNQVPAQPEPQRKRCRLFRGKKRSGK